MSEAKKGNITKNMQIVAADEFMDVHILGESIAQGEIIILKNYHHKKARPVGVGKVLKTKVNANVVTSTYSVYMQSRRQDRSLRFLDSLNLPHLVL